MLEMNGPPAISTWLTTWQIRISIVVVGSDEVIPWTVAVRRNVKVPLDTELAAISPT